MLKKFLLYFFLYILTGGIVFSVFFLTPTEKTDFPVIRLIIIFFATTLLIKYFIYMVISPWHDVAIAFSRYRRAKKSAGDRYEPPVSVLVPARNEEAGVVTTLKSLLESSYKNFEIIVIDSASTDNTGEKILSFIGQYNKSRPPGLSKVAVSYLKEERPGKGRALNKGIAAASGEIIISVDADCFIAPETLANFVSYFRNPRVMAAVGNVKIGNTQNILGVVQYLEFLFSFYFKKSDSILGSIYIIGGAAGAFRKEVFKKIGGYSLSNITEDIDLSVRIQYAGMKIVYAEDAVVYTEGAADFSGLIRQRLRWKSGRIETFLKHRHLFFSTQEKHNKILTWFILPLAIFGEVQLALELFFIIFVYVYSYLTNDYSSFISGIIVVSSMFAVQIIFDFHRKKWGRLVLLAPIGWLLLYISTFVEFQALIMAFRGYLRKEKTEWQIWKRKGVF